MNLEDFFIAEYEKLKDENEKLKSQVAELSKPKGAGVRFNSRALWTGVDYTSLTHCPYCGAEVER